jgi:DNA-binding response OmpR family regulator
MNHIVKQILVVEDEEKILEVVKSFLESKGFTVLAARDGRAALEIFEKESIGLVLLDLMLPLVSGEEVCRILRRKSKVPVIMLTAKSDEADLLQGLGLGADDYITKPFSLKALYARIEAVEGFLGYELHGQRNERGQNDYIVQISQYRYEIRNQINGRKPIDHCYSGENFSYQRCILAFQTQKYSGNICF